MVLPLDEFAFVATAGLEEHEAGTEAQGGAVVDVVHGWITPPPHAARLPAYGGALPLSPGRAVPRCGTRSITWSTIPYSVASRADMNVSRSVSRSMRSIVWPVCFSRISLSACFKRRNSLA